MLEAAGLGLSAGGRELVRALDLSLAPGAFWSLLGRNGSGKTSLILALADTLARTVVAPAELPVGVLTATIGAPVLLFLLGRLR